MGDVLGWLSRHIHLGPTHGDDLKRLTAIRRMGCTTKPTMLFDLTQLVQTSDTLDEMSRPFIIEDIDSAIKQMPVDKAPGPGGFNGFFLKSCWEIVKEDFYNLCFDFFNGSLDLQSINNSHITLIPKTNNPATDNDFRPIFLLNYALKVITKLLANRLQSKIMPSFMRTNMVSSKAKTYKTV